MQTRHSVRLLVVLASGLVGLLLAEVGMRLYVGGRASYAPPPHHAASPFLWEPERGYGYRLRPGFAGSDTLGGTHVWPFTITHDGLRATPARPAGAVPRVLFLGDSYTFGWGVADGAAFPAQVGRILAETGTPIEALNAGVPGFNTTQAHAWLTAHGAPLLPDALVLGYVMNDARGLDLQAAFQGAASYLWAAGRYVLHDRLTAYPPRPDRRTGGTKPDHRDPFRPGSPNWRQSKAALEGIAAFADAHALPFLVVILPDFSEPFGAEYPYEAIHAEVARWAEASGAEVLDLRPAFAGWDHRRLWVPGDDHPNAEAHRIIAEHLAPHLRALLETA